MISQAVFPDGGFSPYATLRNGNLKAVELKSFISTMRLFSKKSSICLAVLGVSGGTGSFVGLCGLLWLCVVSLLVAPWRRCPVACEI